MGETLRVAIIGAGPYGLSAAAHLAGIGLRARVFGVPMAFWRCHMPAGMRLRSPWRGSHLSDPRGELTLDEYRRAGGRIAGEPIPIEDFIGYADWFRQRAVREVDERLVRELGWRARRFHLVLEHGERVEAERVVVAAGLKEFAYVPPEWKGLPRHLVAHAADHGDLSEFAGRRVIVIGSGQSAIESAALLAERGAEVELIARHPHLHWLGRPGRDAIRRFLYRTRQRMSPPSEVGPFPLNWAVELPGLYRSLRPDMQRRVYRRVLQPAGAEWLYSRVAGIRTTFGRRTMAVSAEDGVRLELDDGTQRRCDHVLLATGYRADISRYGFLSKELLEQIQIEGGSPLLSGGFESSISGLHFIGASSALSFGPLMRFVWGAGYTGRRLARTLRNHA